MIKRKMRDALTEKKVKIHGVPFIHRVTENKFDKVETWVRADGHGTIRKTDDDRFGARYEMWNDIAKKYETRVIEPKDEIEEVVDLMEEDISEGERKKKAREEGRKRMMGDAKAAVTPQGYEVVSLFDLGGTTITIIHRPKTNDYLWAYNYQDDGTWQQGHYDFDSARRAILNMKRKYPEAKFVSGLNDAVAVKDDYGWEIPSGKAWDAYESVKKELGPKLLLHEMTEAMDTADTKEAVEDIAADWDEEAKDIDELVEVAGEEEVLDAIAQWLSFDDLADNLAFICRMNDLQIPELEDEEEIEVDEDIDMDDALWAQPDNDAGSAGILTKARPIKYKDYLILTREDGMFDVYTRRDFDLVGTAFKTIEEAKKNIDEGRKGEHVKTEVEEDFDEDDDVVEAEEEPEEKPEEPVKPDPKRKRVSFANHNIVKQEDGTWTILYGGGLNVAARKPVAKGLRSFQEAVKWMFDNVKIQKFPTSETETEQLIMEYMPAEFKDAADKVKGDDVKIGLVFAYGISPNKHFEVIGNTATDDYVVVRNPKGELEIGATEDIAHGINTGELILVSKGE